MRYSRPVVCRHESPVACRRSLAGARRRSHLARAAARSVGPDPGVGTNPQLPPPDHVDHSDRQRRGRRRLAGWRHAERRARASRCKAFANGLDHPRWVYTLPNGDVLVAETNAPPKPDDGKGFKGAMMKLFMKSAGAATASANRITLLRDADGDGVAETRTVFLEGLNSPFGMALVGDMLYIANTDAVVRVPYRKARRASRTRP